MRTEMSRRGTAQARPPRPTRRGRAREPDAPVRRGQRAAEAATRLETAPQPIPRDPDAPVLTRREMFEEHVRVLVISRLADHEVDQFPIHVAVEGARVVIYGVVPDTLTSQLAEDLVWSVPAVRQCDNHLRVG
jgi:hypothetical protein